MSDRTEAKTIDDLVSLNRPPANKSKALKPKQKKQPIPSVTSEAQAVLPGGENGGIASPLVEKEIGLDDYEREYYDQELASITSSDGFFTLVLANPKKLTSIDARGNEVVQILQNTPLFGIIEEDNP